MRQSKPPCQAYHMAPHPPTEMIAAILGRLYSTPFPDTPAVRPAA